VNLDLLRSVFAVVEHGSLNKAEFNVAWQRGKLAKPVHAFLAALPARKR
jgi:hypothetical protein